MMYELFPTEDVNAVELARSLRPGVTVLQLKDAMGEPDRAEAANGHLYFLYRNPPMAAKPHTVAEVDPTTGRVVSLVWGNKPGDGWIVDVAA